MSLERYNNSSTLQENSMKSENNSMNLEKNSIKLEKNLPLIKEENTPDNH